MKISIHNKAVLLRLTKGMLLSDILVPVEPNIIMYYDVLLYRNKLVDGSTMTDILN